jgi:hypothetical protein
MVMLLAWWLYVEREWWILVPIAIFAVPVLNG